MRELMLVATGGAIGALGRYGLSNFVVLTLGRGFPYATLIANVVGSLIIGVMFVLVFERALLGEPTRLLLMVGLLGAFTTFSTFSLETVNLMHEDAWLLAAVNVLASVVLCLGGCYLGQRLARMLVAMG